MFKLQAPFRITQPQQDAVGQVLDRFARGEQRQVILGVTGSGKTYTMAHIIASLNVPTLVLSPNKTLAAQLYQEFRGFFPENHVGYFISYYDYYMPEAFVPQRNLYIAKEVSINPELERLRLAAVRNLLEHRDTIVVASVSSIYSIGSPQDFAAQRIHLQLQATVEREQFLRDLVALGYSRTADFIEPGKFRVRGDLIEVFPSSEEMPIRIALSSGAIKEIAPFDPITGQASNRVSAFSIFPISYFFFEKKRLHHIIRQIKTELDDRSRYFLDHSQDEFAERLKRRTLFDLEMLEQFGYCPGIENYSLYMTQRRSGEPPYTLLDFFPANYLTIIDESHITVPQLNGMFAGDRSRKQKLVDYGFRLPSALDNRPLNFAEINERLRRLLYVSATPAPYEIADSRRQVTELLVRPTGLLDPHIDIRPNVAPIEDLLQQIHSTAARNERALVTTLTKRMAEKLASFLSLKGIRCAYLHSEIKALERVKLLKKLRQGEIDVLIGINLLREGLDLPEVSLVAVLDADKEGFLRSETSLIQTFGRAARNRNGTVILYAQTMTGSLQRAIAESQRRRQFQSLYNRQHHITPTTIAKRIKDFHDDDYWIRQSEEDVPGKWRSPETLQREIERLSAQMKARAENLDFKGATVLRDRITKLKNILIELV